MRVAEEIYFLAKLTGSNCGVWRHQLVAAAIDAPSPNTTTTLLTFEPPQNTTWVITRIDVRSIPTVDAPDLTVGDWRSFDYDASGTARLFLTAQGNSVTPENATYFALSNRPVLIPFAGGTVIKLRVTRQAGAVPDNGRIVVTVHGFLAPPNIFSCLAGNMTQIEAKFA